MLGTLASIARLHIVAIGAMGTLTFGFALCGTRPWLLAAVCASDWFIVNLLNRVVDLKEDQANGIAGTDLVARNKRAVLACGFGVLAVSLVVTAVLVPALLPFRVAFQALGFAYNWPLLPGKRRIKELAFWKNTASATGFLITVFAYPLVTLPWRDDVTWVTVACSMAFFFLFELSYEVLYDLRDVEGDKLANVHTWPVLFGPRRGFHIAAAQMVASFVVVATAYTLGALPWRIAIMGVAPLIQLVMAKRMVARGITTRDCIVVTWAGTALLIGYHVWEVLGLPGAGA